MENLLLLRFTVVFRMQEESDRVIVQREIFIKDFH